MLMNTLDRYIGKSILGAIFCHAIYVGWPFGNYQIRRAIS